MQQRETYQQRNSRQFAALCDEILRRGLKVRFCTSGESMRPNILADDAVIVARVAAGDLSRGDIVLTRGEDGLRVHRVAYVNAVSGEVITRGDSGQENDGPAHQVLGKIIAAERNGEQTLMAGALARLQHSSQALLHRLKLASARKIGQLSTAMAFFGMLIVFGLLTNASPATAQADLSLTQVAAPLVIAPNNNIAYTLTLTNNGPNTATTAVVYQQTPPNTTFVSIVAPAGWTTTAAPAVGGTGQIILTRTGGGGTFTNGSIATFTITVRVNAGVAAGTVILNSTDTTSATADPVATNDASTSFVLVENAAQADLSVSMTVLPTPVFVNSTLTYSMKVQNLGLINTVDGKLVDTIPAGTTFVSSSTTQGSCAGAATVTCTFGAITNGTTITVTITVTTPATATTLANTATVSSTTLDPVAGNNGATVLTVVQPLVCASPGRDGAGGALTGVVNAYYPPASAGTLAAGATSVTLGAVAAAGAQKAIAAGDLLLIIQTQDAAINFTNTGAYGDGLLGDPGSGSTSLNNSGNFEFVTATNAIPITGGALTFLGTGPTGGLLNTYTSAAYIAGTQGQRTFQVIRVPQYTSATLSSTLAAMPWNGTTGGVLALDVASQLTLGGTVAADAQGSRGGAGRSLAGGAGAATDYVTLATVATNGSKGEGIAGTPRYVVNGTLTNLTDTTIEGLPNGSYSRGAPGNAGGGATDANPVANDQNGGGGGGGNGGIGGQGGFGWNSAGIVGGFGGASFPSTTSALVMGGGGGAGTTNNGTADPANANPAGINSSGANGGGIVIIHAGSATGVGTISANGQTALNVANDGGGGGGAGGSIRLLTNSGGLAGLTVRANGGKGGNTWGTQAPGAFPGNRHGPGGGGSGGAILLSAAPASVSVTGGNPGVSTTVTDAYGATTGGAGTSASSVTISQTPGTQPGGECATADLSVTNSGLPISVQPANNITYTQVVSTSGPLDAVNATFSEAIPANTTFQSISVVGAPGWACITPAVGATGTITCANPLIAAGSAAATFTVQVQVNPGTTFGTQIVDVANVTSGTTDPNLLNNTAIAINVVGSATSAELSITKTAAATTVLAGSSISYTVVLTNNGPAAAAPIAIYDAIPIAGKTTFGPVTTIPGGWVCGGGGASDLTCSAASLAAGASVTFKYTILVDPSTASGTVVNNTVTESSPIPNPNPTAGSSTASVLVATAGQADLSMASSASPNPVLAGNNITYTQAATNNGPAAATTATFTDTIPAGTTFVSFVTPAGWNCGATIPPVGGTGTITCTIASIPSGTSYNFPLVVKVNPATAPGTTISNVPNISAVTVDPNGANNSATANTVVASPTQADVSILKTASPEPVNQSTNLTYTLQVTNNGPAVAKGVIVTDPIPAQVTYVSSSATQGACVQAAGTVTCNIGTIGVGGLVIVTINVSANTFSSGTTSSNTATVTSNPSNDPNASNNSSTAISTIQAPTAVELTSFRALPRAAGGVVLEWHTREEVRNLGFNIYREDVQGRHRINPSLIAGSALFLRGGRPQHGAKTYQWLDPAGTAAATYWLEDVDLNGTRTTHGPASVDFTAQDSKPVSQATLLTHLNRSLAFAPTQPMARLSVPRPVLQAIDAGVYRAQLEQVPAVKISVRSEGWYSVSRAELVAAGLDANADVRMLQLFAEGIEQPMRIVGSQRGPLGPNDKIEFYGTGIDTPYSDLRVYWLIHGSRMGKRIPLIPAAGSALSVPQSFPFTVVREDRTTYFATLLNGENSDNFFGAAVTSEPVDQDLTVSQSDATSGIPIALDVILQGVTEQQAHRVSVSFNGAALGEMDFSGQANAKNSFPVDPSLLHDGSNTVTLTALEGDNDVSLAQSIELHYAHKYIADSNWLRAQVNSRDTVHIAGFSNPQIHIVDVTDPLAITELQGAVHLEGASYGVTLSLPGSGVATRVILAFSGDQVSSPAALSYHRPSALAQWRDDDDIVMIAHPDFVGSLAPLVKFRELQGHDVALVTIDQIFDDFNYGERSPFAIRAFLRQASRWRRHPHAVLFVGDASLDPRNYLGFGDFDFVPTRIIETAAFKTASDDWFTDFRETGFATIPTGRLPVRTPEEAALVVSKIVNYERGAEAGSWNHEALFIADQNIGVDFTSESNLAAAQLPAYLHVTKIVAEGQDPATVRQQILSQLGQGSLLVNYIGHGSTEQWSFADLLDNSSAAGLTNGGRTPVYLLMDCLNGFFQDVYTQSLAESLLLAPQGGAVAVWASSGFTDASPQAGMNQALLQHFSANAKEPIGLLILKAKSGITDRDVRRSWILFGDPAMRLQP